MSTLDECVAIAHIPPSVTVVVGPAGAGKTTLLAEWAGRCAGRPDAPRVAWVSVDTNDNVSPHLWSAIRDALLLTTAWEDHGRLDSIPFHEPGFAAAIIAAFADVSTPICLVLDNAHELRTGDALLSLDILARHTPERLRLVLAMRYAPPLHLSRLRVEGRLREIRSEELAFTRSEAEDLFVKHQVRLTADEVDTVLRQTEGWTGGLRLAAMAMRTTPAPVDPGDLPMFSGEDETVADYLTEEVLAQHPAEVHRFLVTTSVCDVLSGDLATAMSERPNSGEILDLLDRTNSLVSRIDESREWYRCHPILRGHLQAELRRTRPRDRPRLHHAAAQWYRDSGAPITALEHAISAEHGELTGELVETSGLREIMTSGGDRLHALLGSVPHQLLARPVVGLVAALTALDAGDPAACDRILDQMGRGAHPLRSDHLSVLQATVLVHRGRFGGDLAEPLQIMSMTPAGHTGEPALDSAALLGHGIASLWRGEHRQAETSLRQVSELASHEGFDHAVLQSQVYRAALAISCDEPGSAHRLAQWAIEFAEEKGWGSRPVCALAYVLLGARAYQRLDDAEARRMAARATAALTRRGDATTELATSMLDIFASFDDATDPHAVVIELWKHWQGLSRCQVAPALVAHVAPIAQRMALRVGEQQWAAEMADQVAAMLGPCGEQALLQAVLHSHHSRAGQARKTIAPLLARELRPIVATTLVDAWLLEAVLVDRTGSRQQAHQALTKALAEPIEAIRPFLSAGKPIRDLLAYGAGRFGRLDPFATTTMTALPALPETSTDVLTSRERDLLIELPSMRTAEEIADSMFVSVNTVKTHLRGIYRKLGVNQRRDAVLVARQRGLI